MITISSIFNGKKLPKDETVFEISVIYDPLVVEEDIEEPEVEYYGIDTNYVEITDWSYGSAEGEYIYEVTIQDIIGATFDSRSFSIRFGFFNEEEAEYEYDSFFSYQANGYKSIWEDDIYNFGASYNQMDYQIRNLNTGETILVGKAIKSPSANAPVINVSRIVESYLDKSTFNLSPSTASNKWYDGKQTLDVAVMRKNADDILVPYYIGCYLWDWSYEEPSVFTNYAVLNRPVNGHLTSNMIIPFGVVDNIAYNYSFKWTNKSGTSSYVTIGNANYPIDFTNFNAASYSNIAKAELVIGSTSLLSYDTTYCGRYSIYYRNRYGVFDAYLFEGSMKETDNFTRESIETIYREKEILHTDLNESYTLTTGLMTDAESRRFAKYILPSTEVYLRDNTTGKITAVNINASSTDVKEFKTNGRKFAQYTIKLDKAKTNRIK